MQVRSQKSTFFKLKFQTEEVFACLLARAKRSYFHKFTTRVLAFF